MTATDLLLVFLIGMLGGAIACLMIAKLAAMCIDDIDNGPHHNPYTTADKRSSGDDLRRQMQRDFDARPRLKPSPAAKPTESGHD